MSRDLTKLHADKSAELDLEHFLPYRLNVLAEIVSTSLSQIYSQRYGIAIPEWRVIATLGQYPSMTAKQVGQHSHMHKTKVSRAVTTLDKKGLVERTANSADLREEFLSLSAEGRKIYDQVVPAALTFSDRLFDTLSETERRALDAILTKLSSRSTVLAEEIAKEHDT